MILRALGATQLRAVALLALLLGSAEASWTQAGEAAPRFPLSTPLQENLLRLQDQWLVWNSAVLQADRELADSLIDDLLSTAAELGFRRLPELAVGAAARAVEVARDGDAETARSALAMAERLDPGRAEIRFARSRVAWLEGRYVTSVLQMVRGYARAGNVPGHRRVWWTNSLLWLSMTLTITAVLFVALQMATKGEHVLRDLAAAVPGVGRSSGLIVALVLLGWPFLLSVGWAWALLYWIAILWRYASTSERWALAVALATIGMAPAAMALQGSRIEVALQPESKAVEHVVGSRLYGDLFDDLERLAERLPDSAAVDQLIGDVQVALGQDELARPLYHAVIEREPRNGPAIVNLGVFHFNRSEYVQAIEFFDRAREIEETAAVASYNLSSSYRRLLEFDNADANLSRARSLDSAAVASWIESGTATVTIPGGIRRAREIREQLAEPHPGRAEYTRWLRSSLAAAGALLLGWILAPRLGVRGRSGWMGLPTVQENSVERWTRRLVPGIVSAEAGDGGRAYLAIVLPVAALAIPLTGSVGFRVPWSYDPGAALAWGVGLAGFALFYGLRFALR